MGEAADCGLFQLNAALNEEVAGAVFVLGSRANTPGTIRLGAFVDICHQKGIPVVVDAAGESDLKQYIQKGADLVVASSQKWLGGPTAGLIAGRRELVHACYLNGEFGIGRPMKAGKEGIAGLIGALETYALRNNPEKKERDRLVVQTLKLLLQDEPGLTLEIIAQHEESPSVCVLRVHIDPQQTGLQAWELGERMMHGDPRIAIDAYSAAEGYVTLDPGLVDIGEEETIAARMKEVLTEARQSAQPADEPIPRFELLVSHMKDWQKEHPVKKF